MINKKTGAETESPITEEHDKTIEERKKKFFHLFKNNVSLAAIIVLLVICVYAFNVRSSNVPQLKDVTTGNYTLGPDLDPFLFLRWTKYIVEHGSIMQNDAMRYYPVGYKTSEETLLLPYLMVYTYKILHAFDPSVTVEYAAVIFPAIFFVLAIIAFFLFVRRLFIHEESLKRNLIALSSTLLFSVMPSLVHRTVAGIPEKEAAGIFFLFLTLYFFTIAFQSKTYKSAIAWGVLAGISTGLLGWVWGAITFVLLGIGLAMFVCFILGISKERQNVAYLCWMILFSIILGLFTSKYGGLKGLFASTTASITYLAGAAIIVDFLLAKYVYPKIEHKLKAPKKIVSLLSAIVLGVLFFLIISPNMVIHIFHDIQVGLLHPQGTDRIALTVAENNQPYFSSWEATYTMEFFWIFIAAAVLLFYGAIKELKNIEKYILSSVYFLFLIALIFSRYAQNHTMNGTSTLSQVVYFGGFFMFAAVFAFIYLSAYKNKETEKISKINGEAVILLAFFLWAAISARGAIRLFFLLDPIVAILAGFILIELPYNAVKSRKDTLKMILWICASLIVLWIVGTSFYQFAMSTSGQAKATVPSAYTVQWQYAMKWVRDNTPQNSVFAHWWDYGYWLQSIGERPTVVDGGNTIGYWDHLVGRHVLTAQNETEALEFMLPHNVSYLLVDSTDIGKYPAYSSIGSDLDYDRYNWIPSMIVDEKQTQETRNSTILIYGGVTTFDKDFTWYDISTKQQYLFPQQSSEAVIAGVLVKFNNVGSSNQNLSIVEQPKAVVIFRSNSRIDIPICYLYMDNQEFDYRENGPCMPSALYIIPKLDQTSTGGISINQRGAGLYLNEKALNALWVNLYLLDKKENFELVHSEQSYIMQQLRKNGFPDTYDFVYFGDVQGPIKIWKVKYPEGIAFKQEYLETNYPDIRLLLSGRG